MPKMWVAGLEEFGSALLDMTDDVEKALKAAVYDGAHELFTEVESQIRALPESDHKGKHRDITAAQKKGLLDSLYGSRIQVQDNEVYSYISFDGYNSVRTKKYPHGQPNIIIARSLESGGTYMNKRVFMTKAKNAARPKAIAVMKKTFDAEMAKKER